MAFIGNEKIVNFFAQAILAQSLAHAYCLVGPEQIGKQTLARRIASQLLKIDSAKLTTHPDFYYLARELNAKTGKLKQEVSISQARQLKEQIGKKPWLGGYSVVVIDEAELLNKESGNALLKVLEETSNKTVFFLLTTDDSALLPTIRSRCQLFYLALVLDRDIRAGLIKLGYNQEIITEVMELAWGRPGRAIDLAQTEELRQQYYQEMSRWQEMIAQPFFQRLKNFQDLLASKDINNKEKLQNTLDIWIVLWRQVLRDKVQNQTDGLTGQSQMSAGQVAEFIDLLGQTKKKLRQNVNQNLLFEEVLLSAS